MQNPTAFGKTLLAILAIGLVCLLALTIGGSNLWGPDVAQAASVNSPAKNLTLPSGLFVLAKNSVEINKGAVITGDVVVNEPSVGTTVGGSADLVIERDATINGSVAADTVELNKNATVVGTISVSLDGLTDKGGSFGGQNEDYAPPIFEPFPTCPAARPPGEDMTVGASGETLGPASYGTITLDKGAVLTLTGGEYSFESIVSGSGGGPGQCSVSPCRKIRILLPADIRIAERFSPGKDAQVSGIGVDPEDILISVHGFNGGGGGPTDTPVPVDIGQDSDIAANFCVPNGTVRINKNTTFVGAILRTGQPPSSDQTLRIHGRG